MNEDINRIKTVLCEKKRTNKWLAEQLNVNPTTVSKWCTNTSQPDLYTLKSIASLLEIDIRRLLNPTESHALASEPLIIYGIKND
ncbi:MAG: helix-turn-helix domain-containing protein [Muribaculaceae bacterium]|nr:helix-turn-helix domain-containing protein [Muribaculaceae bacterium]